MKRILFVHVRGGVPIEFALPRVAACGEVFVTALAPLPDDPDGRWRSRCAGVLERWHEPVRGEEVVDLIVEDATAVGADLVTCMSEYALLATALAAERLGQPGAGGGVRAARDKRLMREVWRDAGVPVPAFRRVRAPADVVAAFRELEPPLLLKAAWGAGGIGQAVLSSPDDVDAAWAQVTAALERSASYGLADWYVEDPARDLLVEEIVRGTTEGWYDGPGYGDFLSVEGVVSQGTYRPVCITGRMPTIPPFTELSCHAPCGLPEELQRTLAGVARRAVDALGLDTCGTHTELKLAANGEVFLLESAARLGGSVITEVVESVFGVDLISLLTRDLLGEDAAYPDDLLVAGTGAAADVALIATDSAGTPWRTTPVWDSARVDWARLVSPGTTVRVVRGLTVPDGTPMPPYTAGSGLSSCAGMLFLRAEDHATMLADCYSLYDGLEEMLDEAGRERALAAGAASISGAAA